MDYYPDKSPSVGHILRGLLNGQLRNREIYTIDNISAIWHLKSCNGVDLPQCRGGIFYPKPEKWHMLVFVTDPQYNRWAEENNLKILHKWVNTNHIPWDEYNKPEKVPSPISNIKYEDIIDQLGPLVDDLWTVRAISEKLNLGMSKTTQFRKRYRIERDKHKTLNQNKRITIGDK